MDAPLSPGAYVAYQHPDWSRVVGRVIRIEGYLALCQDLSPGGAREWWPVAELAVVVGGVA